MNQKIKHLDHNTINKIAAGEVVEDPASVVKELVDNALDSGATHIEMTIKASGRQQILVSDNGEGISKEDLPLCFERHATSKLQKLEDLEQLSTMGFRGEALASIASVAKVKICSCSADQAFSLSCEGGKLGSLQVAARAQGTSVEVNELFFNTPVRQKFRKSPTQEGAQIVKTVSALALANPDLGFTLHLNGKETLKLPAKQDLLERIKKVLGLGFCEQWLPVFEKGRGGKAIVGYLGDPSSSRPNRLAQYLSVNGRPVQSPMVASAVKEAYGARLETGRYPAFVLDLTLPQDLVDVNVHPQKKELRFSNEGLLRNWLMDTLSNSFLKNEMRPSSEKAPPLPWEELKEPDPQAKLPLSSIELPCFSQKLPLGNSGAEFEADLQSELTAPSLLDEGEDIVFLAQSFPYLLFDFSSLKRFGIFKSWCAKPYEGWLLLDVRVVQTKLFEKKLKDEGRKELLASQGLLVSIPFSLPQSDVLLLQEKLEALENFGFSLTQVGAEEFALSSVPQVLSEAAAREVIANLGYWLRLETPEQQERHMYDLIAQRAALTPKQFSEPQARSLLLQLLRDQQPFFSEQGEKTMALLTTKDLSRQFVNYTH